jgi:hypothetical protein
MQRSPGPHPSSPQQCGLLGGQHVLVILVLPAIVPAGQQYVDVSTRFFGQQRRRTVAGEDRDERLCRTRSVVDMHTSSVPQHSPPQHCSPFSQQRSPQHVCVDLQQWSSQHFSAFLPVLQQSRPHVLVLLGHRHVPVFGSHSLAGGQQRPPQHLSDGAQHVERLSFAQHFAPRGQHLPPAPDWPLPASPRTRQASSSFLQHMLRLGAAQYSVSGLQQRLPHFFGQFSTLRHTAAPPGGAMQKHSYRVVAVGFGQHTL